MLFRRAEKGGSDRLGSGPKFTVRKWGAESREITGRLFLKDLGSRKAVLQVGRLECEPRDLRAPLQVSGAQGHCFWKTTTIFIVGGLVARKKMGRTGA